MRDARSSGARLMAAIVFVLGLAMIVSTLARGGGPLAVGILVGAAFVFLGYVRFRAAGSPR